MGRLARYELAHAAMNRDEPVPHRQLTPFQAEVGKGVTHCGAGCTLGDIIAEWLVFFVPVSLRRALHFPFPEASPNFRSAEPIDRKKLEIAHSSPSVCFILPNTPPTNEWRSFDLG